MKEMNLELIGLYNGIKFIIMIMIGIGPDRKAVVLVSAKGDSTQQVII